MGADTSVFDDPLQNLVSLCKMRMLSFSLSEEYAELGTSGEQSKKPGSLN